MENLYTEKAKKVLDYAKEAADDLEHSYVGTEHLLIGLVHVETSAAGMVLKEQNVTESKMLSLMEELIAPIQPVALKEAPHLTPRARKVLEGSETEAYKYHQEKIGTEHILLSLIKEQDCGAVRLLHTMGVNIQKLCVDLLSAMGVDGTKVKEYLQAGKNGKGKTKSPTAALENYSRELTKLAKEGALDPVVGRQDEIKRMMEILCRRSKNNPCLIGEPGVGKTAIVEALAQRIVDEDVPDILMGKRLFTLDVSGMVAGSKYRGEFEERVKKILNEVRAAGNIILFIDEIHTIIGAGGAEGSIDAANILKPALARGELQLIGATTIEEFRKYFERDAALERRFQPVRVEEPSVEDTIEILKGLRPHYEKHHRIQIKDEAIEAAVKLSVRYINDRFLPDKAIDLMDEASAAARLEAHTAPVEWKELSRQVEQMEQEKENAIVKEQYEQAASIKKQQKELQEKMEQVHRSWVNEKNRKKLSIGENQVAQVVARWTKIPVKRLEQEEKKKLRNLEKILHARVVGQEEAVSAVSKAIKRGRVGLKDPKRPIGSFLFLGPTGVGKTELSKALAEAVFGSEDNIIRVDMSEYMEKHSVSKLIGSPPGYVGYEEGGQLSEKVRRNPYSVILFDEIEKAHPDVFHMLLQVLDDGRITDAHGRVVDFKNTIIIMTSNAGAGRIMDQKPLGFIAEENEKRDYETMKSNVMEEVRRIFKPEFLNRIDEIIVFHALTKKDMRSIVTILLKGLTQRAAQQVNIQLEFTTAAKDFLVKDSFDKKYGARPLKREIQNKIEDKLAEEMLAGKVKEGDKVTVSVNNKQLEFTI